MLLVPLTEHFTTRELRNSQEARTQYHFAEISGKAGVDKAISSNKRQEAVVYSEFSCYKFCFK